MKRFWAHLRLFRPLNLITGALAVWVSSRLVAQPVNRAVLLWTLLVVVAYNAGANALNDYWDYETDRINRPDRPLSSGRVTRPAALGLGIAAFLVGSLAVLPLPGLAQGLALGLALPIMVLYTPFLKGTPLVGNAAVAFILGLAFLFSGAAFGDVAALVLPGGLAFSLTLVRELVKDMADLEGDRQAGLRTYPVVAGLPAAGRLAAWLALIVAVGCLYPWWSGLYRSLYGWIALAGVTLPLLGLGGVLGTRPSLSAAAFGAKLLKLSTLAGVVAIYCGGAR